MPTAEVTATSHMLLKVKNKGKWKSLKTKIFFKHKWSHTQLLHKALEVRIPMLNSQQQWPTERQSEASGLPALGKMAC